MGWYSAFLYTKSTHICGMCVTVNGMATLKGVSLDYILLSWLMLLSKAVEGLRALLKEPTVAACEHLGPSNQ